jgi:hypothetical protein
VKISSPIGEYEYRVERVTLHDRHLEVLGRLGEWQTTTIIEPADLVALLRKAGLPLLTVSAVFLVTRRLRRVRH